jgi:3',5'-cyclic AMP phosphodiesterase CpdA
MRLESIAAWVESVRTPPRRAVAARLGNDYIGFGRMIIAQISDTHIAVDVPGADVRRRDLERTIADINQLDPLPDAILHTGDIAQHGRLEEYRLVEAALAKARAPFYLVPGNKDNRANLRDAFSAYGFFPAQSRFLQYAVEDFPVRIFVLDTVAADSNKGDFCEERVRRLIEMTDADGVKQIAVFTHHPPFEVCVGPERLHYKDYEAMSRLGGALQHSERVAGVFSGHVHRSTAGCVGGIPASVAHCLATPLRRGEYPAHMSARPVYHIHRFQPDHGFTTETRIVPAP